MDYQTFKAVVAGNLINEPEQFYRDPITRNGKSERRENR